MTDRGASASEPELPVVITVYDIKTPGSVEFGLQSGKGGLKPGARTGDGAVKFETTVRGRRKADGTVTLSGTFVHGPPNERFFYISFRRPGGDTWVRRAKVMLPDSVDPKTRRLSARVADEGKSRVRFLEGWVSEGG